MIAWREVIYRGEHGECVVERCPVEDCDLPAGPKLVGRAEGQIHSPQGPATIGVEFPLDFESISEAMAAWPTSAKAALDQAVQQFIKQATGQKILVANQVPVPANGAKRRIVL